MNMEGLKLLAHLIISALLILGYVVLVFVKGDHDPTLQGLLLVAVGYWFGAVPLGKNNNDTKQ